MPWCYQGAFTGEEAMLRSICALLLVIVLLASFAFPLAGCIGEDEDVPKKIDNKLDSQLNQLIEAEKRGEAELYAQQRGIDLVDGSARVSIESVPGRLDDVIKVAAEFGTVEIVAERAENVGALIPIASLTALAQEESIHLIRVPTKPTH
jgi:hypothetical protein